MSSTDIAMTGIDAASAELSSISNNIANNQTTGFKRSDVEFADVYAASAQQAGAGVRVSQLRQDFAQGDINFTNNNLDLSIEGQGFFRLSDEGGTVYSREGAFGIDNGGYLINSSGYRVLGNTLDNEGNVQPVDGELRMSYADIRPKQTETVDLEMNFDATAEVLSPFDIDDPATYNHTSSTTVYDSLGTAQVASLYIRKDAPNSWSSYLYVDGVEVSQPGGDELGFDASGQLVSVNGTVDTNFSSTTFTPANGGAPMALNFTVGDITQYDSPFGTNSVQQDGYTAGRLEYFDIDEQGIIYGRYSNGEARQMGQVTLANFTNPQGLVANGGNNWSASNSSGEPAVGEPGSASLGRVSPGTLESSNVDITDELVSMIAAQRSFQANAQVISTGDTITQTIINIRR